MEFLRLINPPDCRAYYGATLPQEGEYSYRMKDRWAFHCYFSSGELSIGENTFRIEPGTVSITPVDVPSVYRVGEGFSYIYGHFIPEAGPDTHRIPLFSSVENELIDTIERGAMLFYLDSVRSRAVLWDVLLSLCLEKGGGRGEEGHFRERGEPSWVSRALRLIGNDPAGTLNLEQLSGRLGISAAQLNRLFKKETGRTVYQYILEERIRRVNYLIRQTDIPLKQIALESGYADLQQFNKHCRKYLGGSPRELRHGRRQPELPSHS